MTPTEAARNSRDSWALAVTAIREQRVRAGVYPARNEREALQASAGPVPVAQLDAVRCA